MELLGGGCAINGPTPSSLKIIQSNHNKRANFLQTALEKFRHLLMVLPNQTPEELRQNNQYQILFNFLVKSMKKVIIPGSLATNYVRINVK